ncbi:hypothetical protein cypCar_00003453 [Cyprinus carpio]|nr:hypothetical protein cypCar_00003453 [Cyprinus carpio]
MLFKHFSYHNVRIRYMCNNSHLTNGRGPSNLGSSRLEYYDSEKKFRNALKAAASGVACPAKRVIYLSQCFTVNKRADAKNKYLIALYTKDEYFAVVAESEQEQEEWYLALTELMTEGKKGQLDNDELDDGYGTISPGTIFKEVWQVNVKPKGLGQTRNLMGVYRLCLSAKTIHLVKLNSETPAVNLPLMSIRRCGHSESFFFIEVGRSSSIGPGEIWVQVEDSVVAQNMHETILDTMKALKAFPDFRPRSKSQSSGSNPIPFITTRRHLGNLPPSQTGLQRPSRTDSVTGTPPTGKNRGRGQRYRTSSEGEGTQDRPLSSGTGSLVHLNTPVLSVGREESGSCCAHGSPGSSQHTRDGGFNSSDEFCPSPCDFRDGARTFEEESSYMERTFLKLAHSSKPKLGGGLSITQQKATQTSSSLDESSPVESKRHQKLPKDDGYTPMFYSIAPSPNADYIPMQPRANHPATLDIHPCSSQQADRFGYMMMLPGDSPSGREQVEYDDYMDMSQLTVAEGFSQASPEAEPSSPPSPGEYIHMDFGSHHDCLGLNMDSLLKDHPPRHSLVAPWNPPNYARPLGCSFGQASTNLDPEKTHDECGDALATSTASGGTPQNTSSSYLNYIALDLREVPRVTRDTPPPHPAHSNLQESDAYAGIDFSVSGGRATASKGALLRLYLGI